MLSKYIFFAGVKKNEAQKIRKSSKPEARNVGYNKDYSVFEDFKHGYFIIETNNYGFIAMIPIGLQTVGSVVFENDYKKINSDNPKQIYKGEKLGHFEYGGSTVLLIFEKGKLSSLTVEQGQRIGKLKN